VFAPRRLTARLVFSEPVNRSSVEAALFLSPDPRQRVRYHWHSRILELEFLDSLEANRTYVISVGSQAKDLRGNPAGVTNTIAFSTGEHIDLGKIDGWLGNTAVPQAIALWAYRLDGESVVNPASRDADYRLQAGKDGHFRFEYLKTGRYRIFAVMDRNADGYWNPPAEQIGAPPWDVSVTDSTMPWISFQPAEFDTLPARIHTSRVIHDYQVDVRLNRSVEQLHARFVSDSGEVIEAADAYSDTSGLDSWHVFPAAPLSAGTWYVEAAGADIFGAAWKDRDTLDVRQHPDTTRPRILYTVPSSRKPATMASDSISLVFNEPVTVSTDTAGVFFLITVGSDTTAFTFVSVAPRILAFFPEPKLEPAKTYKLVMDARLIHDAEGNAAGDTTTVLLFNILSPDSLGALVGRIAGDTKSPFLVNVLTLREQDVAGSVLAAGADPFTISGLPAGEYRIKIIRDTDRNGDYSPGNILPLHFSEPFLILPDTITVRARWESEIRIDWPQNP
jgi:hypothetical protein